MRLSDTARSVKVIVVKTASILARFAQPVDELIRHQAAFPRKWAKAEHLSRLDLWRLDLLRNALAGEA